MDAEEADWVNSQANSEGIKLKALIGLYAALSLLNPLMYDKAFLVQQCGTPKTPTATKNGIENDAVITYFK